jgi:serine/threonine-protein kinase
MPDLARITNALADRYRVERELGSGDTSHVYAATEIALDRPVVIKVVAPEHAGELFADRFAREVKFATRLQHTNIVPVLAAADAGGIAYYTMPLVEGISLRARLASGERIPVEEATRILRDVAQALAYAHDQGIVHRDIKPAHVLLSSGGALVTDFGIAKAISASRTVELSTEAPPNISGTLTSVGSSLGTPAYMSPEQAVGSVVDPRADLYAWGVIAYEVLAGAHPFADRLTPHAMVEAQLTERPVPIAERNPDVPKALADIITRCLEKDADDRPDSAVEVLAAIDGQPVAPLAVAEAKKKRTTRDVQAVVVEEDNTSAIISRRMGVAAALLIFALLVWGWFTRQAEPRVDTPSAPVPSTAQPSPETPAVKR